MNIRPRFSLRTLFVVVMAVGVFSGWIGWNVNQVANERSFCSDLLTMTMHFREFAEYVWT